MRLLTALLVMTAIPSIAPAQRATRPPGDTAWPQHSTDRPRPPIVTPGTPALPVPPPADAVVLFDGKNLDKWTSDAQGAPAKWKVADGAFEVVKGTGTLSTRETFGDVQLHIEWMAPTPPEGTDQDRGNSGVFLMGIYEVQVLDSYQNITYADGQAASIYGQFPPLVNVSRPPGQWQSYDIVFHRPHFDAAGKVISPARMTVLHNGVLVQDNMSLLGPTTHAVRTPYSAHPDQLPLTLQDHGHPVRYRNVWVRRLPA
jgi:hypothetical protein